MDDNGGLLSLIYLSLVGETFLDDHCSKHRSKRFHLSISIQLGDGSSHVDRMDRPLADPFANGRKCDVHGSLINQTKKRFNQRKDSVSDYPAQPAPTFNVYVLRKWRRPNDRIPRNPARGWVSTTRAQRTQRLDLVDISCRRRVRVTENYADRW